MKAKAFLYPGKFKVFLYSRAVFASMGWLAVLLAFVSSFFGSKFAAASCAFSLAVLSHMGIALVSNVYTLSTNFEGIRDLYRKELEPKTPPQKPQSAKIN